MGKNLKLKKSLIKIFKLSFLLGVREIYLFFRNLYGLVYHPFLTLKRIEKEKDFSQGILILGLPAYFWFGTVVLLAILRFLMGIRGGLGWVAQISLVLISGISFFGFLYLFYWLCLTFRNFNGGKK